MERSIASATTHAKAALQRSVLSSPSVCPSSGNFALSCPALLSIQWDLCSVLSSPSIHPVGTLSCPALLSIQWELCSVLSSPSVYPSSGNSALSCPALLSIQWELCSVLSSPFIHPVGTLLCLVQPFCLSSGNFALSCPALLSIQWDLCFVLSCPSVCPPGGNVALSCHVQPFCLSIQWERCSVLSCPALQSIHPMGTYLRYSTPKYNASTNSYLLVLSTLRSKCVRIQREVQTRG